MSNLGRVYFMAAVGLIKIGWSSDVDERWTQLNRVSPVPIDYIGSFPGSSLVEQALHRKFRSLRERGEWFRDAPELRAEIEERCDIVCWPRTLIPLHHES